MVSRLRIARLDPGDLLPTSGEPGPGAAEHGELRKLLRRHLSPATASLFAEPQAAPDGKSIDWFSDLAGQPVLLAQLPEPQQSDARALLARRLQAIDTLATTEGAVSGPEAALLRSAASYPGDDYVYVIDGQPVITFWGYRLPDAAPVSAVLGAGAPGAALGPDGAEPAESQSDTPTRGSTRWLGWLALALLLGVAALFVLGILNWRWPPWGPDYEALLAAARGEGQSLEQRVGELESELAAEMSLCELRARLEAAREEGRQLQAAADGLADQLADALALCPLRDKVDDAEEENERLEGQLQELENQLAARLEACRQAAAQIPSEKPPEPKQPEPTAPPPEETAKTDEALPPCPGERPPEEAPDVALVLDASGSMEFPVTADPAAIRDYRLKQAVGVFFGVPLRGSGPNRLDAAKRGIKNVVGSLPEDVDIGLVVLADCPAANRVGFFSYPQRGRLNRLTDSLRPMRKTPLASGVEQAAQMVDGVNAPGVMVVISDGEDTCGGDPCAVARAIKARKPRLTINVVDILGDGASNCLAYATGGKVLTPREGMSFERSIEAAAADAQKPAHCR